MAMIMNRHVLSNKTGSQIRIKLGRMAYEPGPGLQSTGVVICSKFSRRRIGQTRNLTKNTSAHWHTNVDPSIRKALAFQTFHGLKRNFQSKRAIFTIKVV